MSRTTDVVPKDRNQGKNQLRVGRLVKAHGLKGGLKLELYTDNPEGRFTPGAGFTLQVASGREQLDTRRIGRGPHRADGVRDVVDRMSHGIADTARDLDRVGEQFAGDRMTLIGALGLERGEKFGGATDEVTARGVREHDLPFEADGGPGG